MNSISIRKAIFVGLVFVNIPAALLTALPPIVALASGSKLGASFFGAVGLGLAIGWLWWSLSVPKWRIWAYERVENIARLKQAAVRAQITWPDGWLFSRTEIKSASQLAREKALEAHDVQPGVQADRP